MKWLREYLFVFKRRQCEAYYVVLYSGFPTRMLEVALGNVTQAIANLTEQGVIDPVVKATLTLSESGFVSVTNAIAYGEIKDDSITGESKTKSILALTTSY